MTFEQTYEENCEKKQQAKVTGKRSPRWAVMQSMTIPCKDGTDYLVRLRIVQTPLFGIYLHDIHEDDGDKDPHNHPWSFISIVLRGSYTERVFPDPLGQRDCFVTKTHRRFRIHRMGRTEAHRIVHASAGLKTLIITGPRKRTWYFFRPVTTGPDYGTGVPIEWDEYERNLGAS